MVRVRLAFLGVLLSSCLLVVGFTFEHQNLYTTNGDLTVMQHTSNGQVVDQITLVDSSVIGLYGIAFGPDGQGYAVGERSSGVRVLRFDSSGAISRRFDASPSLGSLSTGKITFGAGSEFFVCAGTKLLKFDLSSPNSATEVWSSSNSINDVVVRSNGNLMVLTDSQIFELTSSGAMVRQIVPSSLQLITGTSLAYDESNDWLYASMFGSTATPNRVFRMAGSSGEVLSQNTLPNPLDIVITSANRLAVTSRTVRPRIFTPELSVIGNFASPDVRMNMAEFVVPEPGTMLALGAGLIAVWRRRKSAKQRGI